MANQFAFVNFFASELLVGVAVGDTTLSIPPTDGAKLPLFASGFYLPLTLWDGSNPPEVVWVTNSPQTGSLTVLRGQEGSSAFGWSAGTQVRCSLTAGIVNAALAAYNAGQVLIANYLPLSGGTLTGPLTLSGLPIGALQAATKSYVDNTVVGLLPLSGGSMSGNINMTNNRILQLPTPASSAEPATKGYADALSTTFTNTLKDRSGSLLTTGTGAAYTVGTNTGYGSGIPDGTQIAVRFHATNRANCTIAVDGTAAIPIRPQAGIAGIAPGVMAIGSIGILEYHSSIPEWLIVDMEQPKAVTTTGGTLAYSVNTGLSLAALEDGLELLLQFHTANTGAVTVNPDTLGATPVRPASGVEYLSGALAQYTLLPVRYNSTTVEFIAKGAPPPPLGTGNLSYSDLTNVGLTISQVANILTVNLTTNGGATASVSNPINIPFTDSAGGGLPVWRQVTGALSVATVVGSTFGVGNFVPFRLWCAIFDNAGTPFLALSLRSLLGANGIANFYQFDENNPQNTSSMGGPATLPGVWYTQSGTALTGKSFRILGYIDFASGLATAGSFNATSPPVKLFGTGIKKPGELVKNDIVSSTTQATTTSGTFAALTNGTTLSVTPTNTCNLQKIELLGTYNLSGAAAAAIQIVRGSTLLGNPIGYESATGGGAQQSVGYVYTYDQAPSGASTYSYQGKTNAGTLSFPASTFGVTIEVKELQG